MESDKRFHVDKCSAEADGEATADYLELPATSTAAVEAESAAPTAEPAAQPSLS